MANQGSSASSILSLPQGGGALQGMGEKFSPDLHTGTGNFTVPIAVPPGRNGFQPQLNLIYSTGNGNGLFGLGWNLSIPGITRKTSQGIPQYNDQIEDTDKESAPPEDIFILSGMEDLVPVSGPATRRRYRPRTEGLFALIERELNRTNDYWEVKTKDGLVSLYGTPGARGNDVAVIEKLTTSAADNSKKVFAWKLTETRDPFGNLIRYQYSCDSGRIPTTDPAFYEHEWDQPLLNRILYADCDDPAQPIFLVSIIFYYETRPDPFSDYRAGFEIRTSKRCSRIRVMTHAGQERPVREYRFRYDNSAPNGVSHLRQIEIVGFDDLGHATAELPPLEFGYTKFEPEQCRFEPVSGDNLPASALSDAFTELVDLHGAGLPDILEMNGTVRYWRNLGGGRFDVPRPMQAAPTSQLSEPGVQLVDANGDGRADLMVTSGELAGFYPLKFDPLKPTWDARSFQAFKQPPTFSLEDSEVRLLDLNGDGITDALRSGARFENFFNSGERHDAWANMTVRERKAIEVFPDVSFSDSRVKLADITGDGLQDIVLVSDRNIEYWPNLGHGNWGARIHMRHSPRLPGEYDPHLVFLGDFDGDGLADLIYIDDGKVYLWINQSGNAWSEPIVINGTPRMNNLTTVRLVDLKGGGTTGVLWSVVAPGNGRPHLFFLDLTRGVKPYLLNAMNNHMGAVTKVAYAPSSQFYLADLHDAKTRWKTPLPFPVQVVSRLEVIDDISGGKLTTEYKYHHGYWDGAEREFHGFGLVEQFDSESFDHYHTRGLHEASEQFAPVAEQYFSPPTLTKTWFHQGAVGDDYGDWLELDLSHEYWAGDPQLLEHTSSVNQFLTGIADSFRLPNSVEPLFGTSQKLSRRAKRDALRSLRGHILRTELYALDGDEAREARPYTITEYRYGLREEAPPQAEQRHRRRIFFPHLTAQRITQWERGFDPMTAFTFTADYDDVGQPRKQASVAMPRRAPERAQWTVAVNRQVMPDETRILATHTRTTYAIPDDGFYLRDRVCQAKTFELANPPVPADYNMASEIELLWKQYEDAKSVCVQFFEPSDDQELLQAGVNLIGHTLNYYDGRPFIGLPNTRAGQFGALTRTETLAFRAEELTAAYADSDSSRCPAYLGGAAGLPDGAPAGFGNELGYQYKDDDDWHVAGYYVNTVRRRHDFQVPASREQRGLVLAQLDALGNRTKIKPDAYWLLPEIVTDAAELETRAVYNYRLFKPSSVNDVNNNVTEFKYSPIGLLTETWVKGQLAKNEGDRQQPSLTLTYDFLAYQRTENAPPRERLPIFVHTTRRIWHDTDGSAPAAERDAVIESREYSDGYGRLIQTRTQAEDWSFGDEVGLPASQAVPVGPATARRVTERVVISGWQIYDNKGRIVEKYEPMFAHGWLFAPGAIARHGVCVQMFYNPRGQVARTVNPDGSEQRIILGRPSDLATPDQFEPTPWESYIYDGNDLAAISLDPDENSLSGRVPVSHHFTPSTVILDCLGRATAQLQRNGPNAATDWYATQSTFDIRGNLLVLTDALGRAAFRHAYDLLNRPLRVESIDAGLRTSVLNAAGNVAEYRDSKGSVGLREYDRLQRLTKLWALNNSGAALTLRERLIYGDARNRAAARAKNQLGKLIEHRDEAGIVRFTGYDFKGNLLDKTRRTISDEALADNWQPDWASAAAVQALDETLYRTTSSYDALNRATAVTYPADVNGHRAVLTPSYNRAGALDRVQLDDAVFVEHIAYNARGQRVFIAYGNSLMTRYTYDPQTFRLARLRTEAIASPAPTARLAAFRPDSTSVEITLQPGGQALQDFAYTYDLVGNITAIDERVPNCGIANSVRGRHQLLRQFKYDPLYRLTRADGRACRDVGVPRLFEDVPGCGFYAGGAPLTTQDNAPDLTERYVETYTYDPADNMLELKHQTRAQTWTRLFGMGDLLPAQWAAAPNNRLTSVINGAETHPYQFDENGNLTGQDTEKHHSWDHADRMIGYRVQALNAANASLEARYLYGADGMRVKKWVRNQQGQTNSTVYVDGVFEHHRQSDSASTRENTTLHVLDNLSRVALVRAGAPLDSRDASPQIQYHLGDHLGSSTLVVGGNDSNASNFINREEYYPYGESSFGSFSRKRYRYSGKERDEESGLYYYGLRYFAASRGVWISCDPTSLVIYNSSYGFTKANPLKFIDSLGLQEAESKVAEVSGVESPKSHWDIDDPFMQQALSDMAAATAIDPYAGIEFEPPDPTILAMTVIFEISLICPPLGLIISGGLGGKNDQDFDALSLIGPVRGGLTAELVTTGASIRRLSVLERANQPKLEEIYARIRAMSPEQATHEIQAIAKVTGFSEDVIQDVREHIFMREHLIPTEGGGASVRYFDADPDIAELWTLAAKEAPLSETEVESLRRLLSHEAIESELMKSGLPYRADLDEFAVDAHCLAPLCDADRGTYSHYPQWVKDEGYSGF